MKSHIFSFSKFKKDILLNETITIDEWFNKFPKLFGDVPLQIVKDIVKADPTSKKGTVRGLYSQWLINLYKNNNLKLEDLYKAEEYLTIFDKVKNKLSDVFDKDGEKLHNRDISFYKTLPDLFQVIKPYRDNKELTLSSREQSGKTKIDNEVELFYEDEYIKVEIPLTYRASCQLGSGTQWCTATGKTDKFYNEYTKDGAKLYVIFDKEDKNKYQFSFSSEQFMDENDAKIESFYFLENSPGFFQKLKDEKIHLYTFIKFLMINLNTSNVKIIKFCKGLFSPYMLTYLLHKLFIGIINSNYFAPQNLVFELIEFFIEDGADINYYNNERNSITFDNPALPIPILITLVRKEFSNLKNQVYLEKFLEYKPDVNIKYGNTDTTPLLKVSEDRIESIAKLLLEAGANPNIKNKFGNNSAFIAINSFRPNHVLHLGFIKYILLLKNYGLDINATNNKGLNLAEFFIQEFPNGEKYGDYIKLKQLYNS